MLENLRPFDSDYPQWTGPSSPPLRRRKTLQQRCVFWLANLLALPIVYQVHVSITADGLRMLLPVSRKQLFPFTMTGIQTDLAVGVSILLFVVIISLWCRIFTEWQGQGTLWSQREGSPRLPYLLASLAGVVILLNAGLFYHGLASQTPPGWAEAPEDVLIISTLFFGCGLALLGWWYSDYSTSHWS